MFERYLSRVSALPLICSIEGDPAPAGGTPPAPPAPPAPLPPAAAAPAAPAQPQAPKPFELPENLKKLAADPNFFNKQARDAKLAELKAMGVKIPKKLRESGTYEQILKAAADKVGKGRGKGKELRTENAALQTKVVDLESRMGRLSVQVATFPTFVDAHLAGMPAPEAAAIQKAYAHITDPIERANAQLQYISAQQFQHAASQPGAPLGAPAPAAPPPAATAAPAAPPPAPPAPIPAPGPTAGAGGPPPPPPGGGPTVQQQYETLRSKAGIGDFRARAELRAFVAQHAREIQRHAQVPS
jgi:hypothetical protein